MSGPWSQDALYKQAQDLGLATQSYMNVFEIGMNICAHIACAACCLKAGAAAADDYRKLNALRAELSERLDHAAELECAGQANERVRTSAHGQCSLCSYRCFRSRSCSSCASCCPSSRSC